MASINFDDYEKNKAQEDPKSETLTIRHLGVQNDQYYIKEYNVLFDFIQLKDNNENFETEVWMSYLGDDVKLRIDFLSKADLEKTRIDKNFLANLLNTYLMDHLDCLMCKTDFLDNVCRMKHEEENDDDTED